MLLATAVSSTSDDDSLSDRARVLAPAIAIPVGLPLYFWKVSQSSFRLAIQVSTLRSLILCTSHKTPAC